MMNPEDWITEALQAMTKTMDDRQALADALSERIAAAGEGATQPATDELTAIAARFLSANR